MAKRKRTLEAPGNTRLVIDLHDLIPKLYFNALYISEKRRVLVFRILKNIEYPSRASKADREYCESAAENVSAFRRLEKHISQSGIRDNEAIVEMMTNAKRYVSEILEDCEGLC
jgi:hypothetical protein